MTDREDEPKGDSLLSAVRFTSLYAGGSIGKPSSIEWHYDIPKTDYAYAERWFVEWTTGVVMEYQPRKNIIADEDHQNVMCVRRQLAGRSITALENPLKKLRYTV